MGYITLVVIRLMIGFDVFEPVAVIDHESGRMVLATPAHISRKVDALDTGPVGKMEIGHTIPYIVPTLFAHQVMRC